MSDGTADSSDGWRGMMPESITDEDREALAKKWGSPNGWQEQWLFLRQCPCPDENHPQWIYHCYSPLFGMTRGVGSTPRDAFQNATMLTYNPRMN